MTAVAHDVVSGVGARAAGLLSGYRSKQLGVEPVAACRARDLGSEGDAVGRQAGGDRIEAHAGLPSHAPGRLTRLERGF